MVCKFRKANFNISKFAFCTISVQAKYKSSASQFHVIRKSKKVEYCCEETQRTGFTHIGFLKIFFGRYPEKSERNVRTVRGFFTPSGA